MKITPSSGNVFEDLGFSSEEAASLKIRAELAIQIRAYVEKHGLTQNVVAKRLGITQPRVSAILRGQVDQFTMDYLVKQLCKLGHVVETKITSKRVSISLIATEASRSP